MGRWEVVMAWDRAKYDQEHKCCPRCGGSMGELEVTCKGIVGPPDTNRASCGCGWVGIVDELVGLVDESY